MREVSKKGKENERLRLSAGDLSRYLGCHFLTQLDWAGADGRIQKEYQQELALEALQKRGMLHEEAYLDFLEQEGFTLLRAEEGASQDHILNAMKKGVDFIVQAPLSYKNWMGRADLLKKVSRPGTFGGWSYEVLDTKLAKETKAGAILQLCLYSDLLSRIQGVHPEYMSVIAPGEPFLITRYPFKGYSAYYRMVRQALEETIAMGPVDVWNPADVYPEPVPQCDFCDWWKWCQKKRRHDDHISIVANITKNQKKELTQLGFGTITSLAAGEIPQAWRPKSGAKEGYFKTQEQAQIQCRSKDQNAVLYETLPLRENYGLAELPPPSPGDIFFDIEGDPFIGTQGLEYLLGYAYTNTKGAREYTGLWSKQPADEKQAFESFVGFVFERLKEYPDLHIYHYAPYEPGAVKRLMGKHAACEREVDSLLRMGKFVDLMRVVKRSMLVGVERYSIKELEALYGFHREVPLEQASKALHNLEFVYEMGWANELDQKVRESVEGYNRDDCVSTRALRDWLEKVRLRLIKEGEDIKRPALPEKDEPEILSEHQKEIRELQEKLTSGVPIAKEDRLPEQHAQWILAQLMEFHSREGKSVWWEYYRLSELTGEELLHEKAALSGLTYEKEVGGTEKNPICRYSFPEQDFDIKPGSQAKKPGGDHYGTFENVDTIHLYADIKKKAEESHADSLFSFERIDTKALHESIMRLAAWVAENGINSPGAYRAARDLLLKHPPRWEGGFAGEGGEESLQKQGESVIEAAIRITQKLQGGVLALQGPPGSGKTYLASRVIAALVAQGKKVGVTALSHKVIRNLLERVSDLSPGIQCAHRVSKESSGHEGLVSELIDYKQINKKLREGEISVLGGTTFMWSRENFFESVDYLFVDEAGQLALADTLASAQGALNLVLLGDPQQLEKPIQGVHPEGTDASALQHIMGETASTIDEKKGLFLADTWRMHPDVCRFISEQFYDDKLNSRKECSHQSLLGDAFSGTGLRYIPVEHEGNQSSSEEEAEIIQKIYDTLISSGSWVNRDKKKAPLTGDDILIITPYNAQVRLLSRKLPPDSKIGTVDKFQGQEAAVVIYSLATSSAEEAPRGMDFLYSGNRLNVAISRAKCMSILVGSAALFSPDCKDPIQMRLANSFCRYKELALTLW